MQTELRVICRLVAMAACMMIYVGSSGVAEGQPRPAFACTDGAVQIDIDRHPELVFEELPQRPRLFIGHEFTFRQTPFERVRVYLTATLPEETVGRESDALLEVYVETLPTSDPVGYAQARWWKLVPADGQTSGYQKETNALVFDAKRVATCFGGRTEDCAFADVSSAASDSDLPMVVLGFTRDLGGANANNWVDSRVLLDFRESPPRVAARADCGYNEGGGACTAIDSGMMPRSDLRCDWAPAAADFVCTMTGHEGHRDFYLLSDRVPPLRPNEVASLDAAAYGLAQRNVGETVTVRAVGPVTWVDEVTMPEGKSGMLLASAGSFFLATHATGEDRIESVIKARPHSLFEAGTADGDVGGSEDAWTAEFVPHFRSREIFRDADLVILQVVAANSPTATKGDALYWIGIELGNEGVRLDAVTLVGHSEYSYCGMSRLPASVASIGALSRPFHAQVRIQPPIVEGLDGDDLAWESASEGQDVVECVRGGNLWWGGKGFEAQMDRGPCAASEQPRNVRISPDGRVNLETPTER